MFADDLKKPSFRILLFRVVEVRQTFSGRETGGLLEIIEDYEHTEKAYQDLQYRIKILFGSGNFRIVRQKMDDDRWVYDSEIGEFNIKM